MSICQICSSETTTIEDKQLKLTYAYCEQCGFIHKNKAFHLEHDAEHNKYKTHNNNFESEGYVKIFVDLIENHIKELKITGKILDFGSGPGPVLKSLLEKDGYDVYDYDPFFNNNQSYLSHSYQLITTTEVAEHFSDPLKEFELLTSLLEDGGYLLVMTKLRTMPLPTFLDWWYRRDATHISFYTNEAFEIIAKKFGLHIVFTNDENIIILQK